VWVAGSTHGGGEEEALIEAQKTRARPSAWRPAGHGTPAPQTGLERLRRSLVSRGVRFVRRSQVPAAGAIGEAEILLLDSLGELLDFYAAGDVAFVGGSLVPIGGHNLLEPAALGLPILTGPNTSNSADVARLLIERGAADVVKNPQELADRVIALAGGSCRPCSHGRTGARSGGCQQKALCRSSWDSSYR